MDQEFRTASLLMTSDWRLRFKAEVMAPVDVPPEVSPTGKASKLASYVAARVRNELDVDWESLKCSKASGLWHCKAKAVMQIQPLLGPPLQDPKLRKPLLLKASFTEVPPTLNTVDGLLVSFWDAKEPD